MIAYTISEDDFILNFETNDRAKEIADFLNKEGYSSEWKSLSPRNMIELNTIDGFVVVCSMSNVILDGKAFNRVLAMMDIDSKEEVEFKKLSTIMGNQYYKDKDVSVI